MGSFVTTSGNNTVILAITDIKRLPEFIGWKPIYGSFDELTENDTIMFERGLRNFCTWMY